MSDDPGQMEKLGGDAGGLAGGAAGEYFGGPAGAKVGSTVGSKVGAEVGKAADRAKTLAIFAGFVCVALVLFIIVGPGLLIGSGLFNPNCAQAYASVQPTSSVSPTPGSTTDTGPAPTSFTGGGYSWNAQQLANAQTIMNVGATLGFDATGQAIGVMTAMDESSLNNIDHGDRDSVGLFQQRPSQGWGSVDQIMDPVYAATKFFTSLKGVNLASMQPWQAAQKVQRSGTADGSNYERFWISAQGVVQALGGGSPIYVGSSACNSTGQGANGVLPGGNATEQAILDWAKTQVGKPYVYGGGRPWTQEQSAWDCSSFVGYAVYMATGQTLGGTSGNTDSEGAWLQGHNLQVWQGPADQVDMSTLVPGQILEFGSQATPFSRHVDFYAGGGNVIAARAPGEPAGVEAANFVSYWAKQTKKGDEGNWVTVFNPPGPVSGNPVEPH